MSLSADAVVLILQSRLDYLSARTVFKQAAIEAGLNPSGPFQGADLEKLATCLLASAPRMAVVAEALRKAGAGAKAPPPAQKAPPVASPTPEPAVAEAPVEVAAPTEADAKHAESEDDQAEGDGGDGRGRAKGKPGKKG